MQESWSDNFVVSKSLPIVYSRVRPRDDQRRITQWPDFCLKHWTYPFNSVGLVYAATSAAFCTVDSWGGHAEAGEEEAESNGETHFGREVCMICSAQVQWKLLLYGFDGEMEKMDGLNL